MKPRTVEVTIRFESTASVKTLRNVAVWGVQLRLAREFFNNGRTLEEAGNLARYSDSNSVKVMSVKARNVPKGNLKLKRKETKP